MKSLLKSVIVVTFTSGVLLTSCNKEVIPDQQSASVIASQSDIVSSYPSQIDEYVEMNYPEDVIVEVLEEIHNGSEIVYEVTLSSGLELVFDRNGFFLYADDDTDDNEEDEIDPSALPQEIIDYISNNYPDLTIIEAELEDDGYEIELSDGTEVLFDLEFNFIADDDSDSDEEDDDMDDDDDDSDEEEDDMDDDDDDSYEEEDDMDDDDDDSDEEEDDTDDDDDDSYEEEDDNDNDEGTDDEGSTEG